MTPSGVAHFGTSPMALTTMIRWCRRPRDASRSCPFGLTFISIQLHFRRYIKTSRRCGRTEATARGAPDVPRISDGNSATILYMTVISNYVSCGLASSRMQCFHLISKWNRAHCTTWFWFLTSGCHGTQQLNPERKLVLDTFANRRNTSSCDVVDRKRYFVFTFRNFPVHIHTRRMQSNHMKFSITFSRTHFI